MILVKIGTSTTSQADAAKNLKDEIPGMDFNLVQQQTEALWNAILARFIIEGGSKEELVNFYTGVYRMSAGPKYSWFPGHAIGGLILSRGADWVSKRAASMTGRWGGGYWGPGNVAGLVGLYKMGFRSMDMNKAYQKISNDAMNGNGKAGDAYRTYGYIPENAGVNDYVNRTIGQSYDDYALSELASIVGKTGDHDFFLVRSKNYRKLFNPSTGFFTPRRADGSWILPLDPIEPHAEDIYREGNAWNYLWFNMGDIPGLIDLLGGPAKFTSKLDAFFTTGYQPKLPLRDITGVMGLYIHGNEQYRSIPYLYNYVEQPWKTQALARKIQMDLYKPVAAGLCGMDDYGDLEGWYVTNALGYYPVDHASGYYEIGSPLFAKVSITLDGPNPGTFVIRANNVSDTNMYIQSATLNEKPLNEPRFRQNDMIAGGNLIFEMGPKPNYNWGTLQ